MFRRRFDASGGNGATGTLSPEVRALLAEAQQTYQQSQTDLKAGISAPTDRHQHLESDLQEVQQLTGHGQRHELLVLDHHDDHDDLHHHDDLPARDQRRRPGRGP